MTDDVVISADFPEAERLGREITEQWDDVQTEMRSLYEILDQLFKNSRFFTENFNRVHGWIREAELMVSAPESKKLVRIRSDVASGLLCEKKMWSSFAKTRERHYFCRSFSHLPSK